jgi:hypothetical protein
MQQLHDLQHTARVLGQQGASMQCKAVTTACMGAAAVPATAASTGCMYAVHQMQLHSHGQQHSWRALCWPHSSNREQCQAQIKPLAVWLPLPCSTHTRNRQSNGYTLIAPPHTAARGKGAPGLQGSSAPTRLALQQHTHMQQLPFCTMHGACRTTSLGCPDTEQLLPLLGGHAHPPTHADTRTRLRWQCQCVHAASRARTGCSALL